MEAIFHEKQEGSLCAQHCLNALLQGPYFSPVDLADIANQLDEQEREHMAIGGLQSDAYRQFLEQPSSNYDDSGFFSIQVIANALRVWGLELLPYNANSTTSNEARANPTNQTAYICNFREHWLSIRKLGNQWFNLNSLLTGPELISDTYLSLFLTQLQQEGYSIFLVTGELPECEADQLLKLVPAVQPIKPRLITEDKQPGSRKEPEGQEDDELHKVLSESKDLMDNDDQSLQKALQMSMEGYIQERKERGDSLDIEPVENKSSSEIKANDSSPFSQPGRTLGGENSQSETSLQPPDPDEVRQKRLAFLNKMSSSSNVDTSGNASSAEGNVCSNKSSAIVSENANSCDTRNTEEKKEEENDTQEELSEDEMLKEALALSMQTN